MRILILLFVVMTGTAFANKELSIEADNIGSSGNIISASGNVVVEGENGKILTNELNYDKSNKVIYTNNKSKIINDIGVVFFESGNITQDMKSGSFDKSGIEFKNDMMVLSDKIYKQSNDLYYANDTTYYVCPVDTNLDLYYSDIVEDIKNKKKNIFSLKSKNVKVDNTRKRIHLKNSFLNFFDVPIFYIPYFFTSRPFINMISGFELPHIESVSDYGTGIYVPYIWRFKNNSSFQLSPVLYQYGSFASKLLYKRNDNDGYLNANFIYLYDNDITKNKKNIFNISENDEGKYKNNRMFFTGIGKYQFEEYKFLDFRLNFTNDNYMYRDYLREYDNYLDSRIDFSLIDFDNFNYINFNAVGFQEIREEANLRQRTTPYVLPRINTHLTTKNILDNVNNNSLFIELDYDLWSSDLFDINDNKYSRYYSGININYNTTKFNSIIKTALNLSFDAYAKRNDYVDDSNENLKLKSSDFRFIPEISFDVRTPYYLLNSKNIILESILQYYGSDNNKNYNKEFINEDSRNSEINILNLFQSNRFNGFDRKEYGNRFNYGFNLMINGGDIGNFSFKLGQAYRGITNYDLRGFEGHYSDLLNGFGYFNDIFSLDYIMNINKDNMHIKSNSVLFRINFNNLSFYTTYMLSNNINEKNRNNVLEELESGIKYRFINNWNISIDLVRDLKNKYTQKINSSIYYDNNCFMTGIRFNQERYLNSRHKKHNSINFYFKLKAF